MRRFQASLIDKIIRPLFGVIQQIAKRTDNQNSNNSKVETSDPAGIRSAEEMDRIFQ